METNWPEAVHPVALPANEVHVYNVPLGAPQSEFDRCQSMLSDDERRRAGEFMLVPPRRRFVIARAAIRCLMGHYLGTPPEDIKFTAGPHGKPQLSGEHEDTDLRFNVAHSGDLALLAVIRGCDVGVDVERLRAVDHSTQIARRYFHPSERDAILAAPPSERDAAFLGCWTLKEAALKAVGSGITDSLAAFSVAADASHAMWVDLAGPRSETLCRCWLQRIALGEDYIGAVACVGSPRRLRCFNLAL
jgi:4'-phosphopantetheinyl transferase